MPDSQTWMCINWLQKGSNPTVFPDMKRNEVMKHKNSLKNDPLWNQGILNRQHTEYNGASAWLFPEDICALWAQESEDETQICVKLATTIVSAFFWQLTWIRRDKKQSTLSTSCHNTLSNTRILLPTYSRKTKHVCHCGCVSEWISSWQ